MSKETEKRLIKTLEFLKEPQGSTIPTIVKAIKDNDPKISLKRIVQTLKGCLENGVVKVADGRVKLKQMGGLSDAKSDKGDGMPEYCSRLKNSQKPMSKCPKTCPGDTPSPESGEPSPSPSPENPNNPENPDEENPKCKPKPKSKPKPKCPKPKKKCSKPKASKPKKKPKCKPKPKKPRCAPKKKIQPYCKKKKKCGD